ncbi:MAG: 3-hydroxyacyl-CoA dehydrogenase NAD-binding domain-containing protein [Alphaproteobacteria bacterium]|jgi:3-hydroxybutyryl-CoA dehydrogenase|nr:3-hydroxyacyl-CoA dehydrogenase NAD-binding domain-containing protein [Alphaproteobacteria bacterium]MDP6516561.1 3-hydroxyacyl-CoA dehydrogenase NAD-binding domain-containing protein [Alphaproteobacteria bacterium]
MSEAVNRVMVVGYGSMGRGIALSFGRAGFATTVLSRDPAAIGDLPDGVSATAALPEAPPDLVIEAVPERMDLKQALLARLEAAYGAGPILASNTSSLPLQEMADALAAPERLIGVHYMHPAEALPMVEVIRVAQTTDEVLARTTAALERTGKDSIVLAKPVIGFLINRLQHAILHEAYCLIDDGIVKPEDVDNFAKRMFGPRLCVTGLIEQKDLSGLDVHAAAQRGIVPHLHHTNRPSRVVQDLVEDGQYGAKTGTGFYDWREADLAAHRRKAADKLARLLALLEAD